MQYNSLNIDINIEKLESSYKANFIYPMDSYIIRNFIKKSSGNIITIHDCFGSDLINLKQNIKCMNSAYNNIIIFQDIYIYIK